MVKLLDRVKQSVAGTASSTTLGAAATGFRTFNTAGAATNDVCRYAIEDDNGAFEIGTIVINSATTGTRTVQISSNSNNALTLTGNAVIFATLSAADFTNNAAPAFVNTIPSSINLEPDATTSVNINGKAVDDGGFPISYTFDGYSASTVYSSSSLPPQLHTAPSIDQSTGIYSLVGSSNSANAGSFNLRVKASDGVNTATQTIVCELAFYPKTNLVGLYDAASSTSYSGSGTTFSDMSGSGGPDLTLGSTATYNSSGKGGVASFTLTGASAITYSGSAFGYGATVFAIFSSTETDSAIHGLIGSDVAGSEGLFMDNGTSTIAARRTSSNGGTSTGTTGSTIIYIDKVTQEYTRDEMFDELTNGAYRSLTYTHARIGTGFNFNTDSSAGHTIGELRAIAIYSSTPSVADITALHAYFKANYSNSSDMAS
jgi:hypothetical protein